MAINANQAANLFQLIEKNTSGAFMLTGSEGTGKFNFAKKVAILFLAKKNKSLPLSILETQVDSGVYPDYFLIDNNEQIITIDAIRKLQDSIQKHAVHGGRVIIINSLDKLSPAAGNALLKVLEEPPENTFFLCICHLRHRVLPTIQSRLKVIPVYPAPLAEILEIHPDHRDLIIYANGNAGLVEKLKTYGGYKLVDQINQLFELKNDLTTCKENIQKILKSCDDAKLLEQLCVIYAYRKVTESPAKHLNKTNSLLSFFKDNEYAHLGPQNHLMGAITAYQQA